jgi:hypothetical protein
MTPPVAMFIAEVGPYGKVFYPANSIAVNLCGIAGVRKLPEDRLPYIRALGFEIAAPNGQPIPHPRVKVDVEA